jgi:hypothetical protein
MRRSLILLAFAILGLAGCGRVAQLEPKAGNALPVRPLMARATPSADQLLDLPPNAAPNRVDELMKRSESRKSDPFDLPPPTGGAAPAPPAGADPQPKAADTGPVTPGT